MSIWVFLEPGHHLINIMIGQRAWRGRAAGGNKPSMNAQVKVFLKAKAPTIFYNLWWDKKQEQVVKEQNCGKSMERERCGWEPSIHECPSNEKRISYNVYVLGPVHYLLNFMVGQIARGLKPTSDPRNSEQDSKCWNRLSALLEQDANHLSHCSELAT